MKHLTIIIILFLSACSSPTTKRFTASDSTTIYGVEQEDKEMNLTILTAKTSLNKFDSALNSKDSTYDFFALKVRFQFENNGEHIWLREVVKKNGEYYGIVNNEPEYIANLKFDDTVKIVKNDISDWMYLENGKLRGGFTTRLLRVRMTTAERFYFDSTNFYKIEE